jgi:electron transport complex protein RnfG
MKKFIDESWLVLVMGIAFACLLAGAQTVLVPKYEANRDEEQNTAIAQVVPGIDPSQEVEEIPVDGNKVFKCLDSSGNLAGWAVRNSGGGFIDTITVLVGLSPDGSQILGIYVLEHKETPGLGNKIDPGEEFPTQFTDKSALPPFEVVKREPTAPHEIQAITGATYSSVYVADIVNDVIKRIVPQLPSE